MNLTRHLAVRRSAAAIIALAIGLAGTTATPAQTGSSPQPVAAATPARSAAVSAVVSVGITVGDLDRSTRFYTSVLGFEPINLYEGSGAQVERLTGVFGALCRTQRLRLGDEVVELTQFLAPEGRPIPPDSSSNDRWFQHIAIVVSDMDRAYSHLRAANVRHASPGPQTLPDWNPNAAGISAFYFKDPDGHVLEVIHFPTGKGDPRWQRPADRLFLGIDHTAIVVADTDRSLAFYRDDLGMTVVGGSENHGIEQERLNNIFGARLRITTLRADSGPGVELLEYLAPSGGRDYPRDAAANDLVHWHTTLVAPDAEGLAARLRAARTSWISPGVLSGLGPDVGFGAGFRIRDPDGHALQIVEAAPSSALPPSGAAPSAATAHNKLDAPPDPAIRHYNLPAGSTLALEGYDPVAYFTLGRAVRGRPELSSVHRGITYRFSIDEHRSLFSGDPERYLPTYGGWCASAMGDTGTKVGIDPTNFKIKDGRLFLFYKSLFADALKDWNKHEKVWEPAADANWRRLTGEAPRPPTGPPAK